MTDSAAHERFPSSIPAGRVTFANSSALRAPREVCAWSCVALGWMIALGLCLPAAAQIAAPQIRPEFRTAPRSLITQAIDRSRLAPATGAVNRQALTAQDLGARDPAAPMENIQLVLRRPAERQAAFDALVEALHRPGNPSYHQWLTPELVGTEFGPSAEDLATLTSYLESEGFTVNRVGAGGLYVDFTGTVAQVQQSFHTEIHNLRLPSGEEHFSAVSDAQLPEALTPLVVGFAALSDISSAHPNYRKQVEPAIPAARDGLANPLDDVSSSNYAVGPQDFYTIYNESPLLTASTPINGSGVTIALLEESAINTADVTSFRTMFGVTPATPASLVVDTGYGSNTCSTPSKLRRNGEEGEAILDIEWAGSVAPGANLIYMQCKSNAQEGILLSAEAVIENNLADVMSLSYGQLEGASSADDTLVNDLWEQAASQGETVVVSAGDSGPDTEDDGNTYSTSGITASSFSTPAWNVSAGGTDFQDTYNGLESDSAFAIGTYWNSSNGTGLGSAKSYIPEMTWNDTCASSIYNSYEEGMSADGAKLCSTETSPYMVAGGGGPSALYTRPSWQSGTVYGLPATSTYPNRLEPDVSLFAANGFWYHDLPSYESDESPALSYAGGTSFVAPQLAGVFALVKQATGERLGQPDYVLYNMAGKQFGIGSFTGSSCNGSGASGISTTSSTPSSNCIFYDVQTGNISLDCEPGSTDCYTLSGGDYGILSTSTTAEDPAFATNQGWDMATGIGSINIANLVNNWQNTSGGGVLYTPMVSLSPASSSYTYGHPSAISYTATVSGPGSFPTGSVTFSGSPTISTIGTDALAGSSGCSSGSTCTEAATRSYTPPGTLAGGITYTITGTYSSTNENYLTGSGTASLTVNAQTPTVTVSAVSIAFGTPTASLSANVAYTGTGNPPSGGLSFQVDSGTVVTTTCTGSSSPLTCTYNGYNTAALTIGTHTISATSIADSNYSTATNTGTLTVLPLPTIVFTVSNHHTMDLPFTVSASSNSSGTITYSVVSGPATIVGSTVTLTGVAGTVVLQASQAASGGFSAGMQDTSFTVAAGSAWLGDSTGALSTFDLTGAAITGSGGFTGGGVGTIAGPLGLAFDASGNVWVANSNGVSAFSRQGVALSSTAFTGGGIGNPLAVAVDGASRIWIANSSGTVSVLSDTGTAVSPASGYPGPGSTPAGIAIDISGSVWVASHTANTVTRILGAAAPVVPLATGAATGEGVEP